MSELEKTKEDLRNQISSFEGKLKEEQQSKDDERVRREGVETELKDLQQSHTTALDEINRLKDEVQKGVEDIVKALKDGYDMCLGRLSNVGVDVTTHSFDDYIRDYAAMNPGGGSAGEGCLVRYVIGSLLSLLFLSRLDVLFERNLCEVYIDLCFCVMN